MNRLLLASVSRIKPLQLTKFVPKYSTAAEAEHGFDNSHEYRTVEEYEAKWTKQIEASSDYFEYCLALDACFRFDIVPTAAILEAAFRKARVLNEYAATVRIFEILKRKFNNNEAHYKEYVDYFRPLMNELGLNTPEELGFVEGMYGEHE